MNTHTDGLYGTTLYKRKTLMNLESAKPADPNKKIMDLQDKENEKGILQFIQ